MSLKPYNKKKSSKALYEYSNIAKAQIDVTSTAESPERPSNNLMPSISSKENRRRRGKVLSSSSESEDQENKDINKETPVKVISVHEHYRDYKTPQEGENKMASLKSSKRRKRRQKKQFVSSGSDTSDEEDDKNW